MLLFDLNKRLAWLECSLLVLLWSSARYIISSSISHPSLSSAHAARLAPSLFLSQNVCFLHLGCWKLGDWSVLSVNSKKAKLPELSSWFSKHFPSLCFVPSNLRKFLLASFLFAFWTALQWWDFVTLVSKAKDSFVLSPKLHNGMFFGFFCIVVLVCFSPFGLIVLLKLHMLSFNLICDAQLTWHRVYGGPDNRQNQKWPQEGTLVHSWVLRVNVY